MNALRVTNIQRGCVYDGPGVRTTVFLKGCSLKCPWCCNPETISFEEQWFIDNEKCELFHDNPSVLCKQCVRIGGSKSIKECPFGVCQATSKDYFSEELLEILIKDKLLYKDTDGGITFSGGEPLLQSTTLLPLLKQLKELEFHVAFETTLCVPEKNQLDILPYVDYLIVDLKLQPQMYLFDDNYINCQIRNLKRFKGVDIHYRVVFVNQMTSYKENIINKLKLLNVNETEVLLCHNLGQNKYKKLRLSNNYCNADESQASKFVDYLNDMGINSSLLTL